MKIMRTDVDNTTINKIIEMGWSNPNGYIHIIQGRLVTFTEDTVKLDTSIDFVSMDIQEYKIKDIKYYFKVIQDNMWR